MTADVLALRALGLGDVLTAVPALRGARRAWPGARLHLAAPAALGTWLADLGVVDAALPTQALGPLAWRGTGHVALNLHGRGPRSHTALAGTRPARLVAYRSNGWLGPSWRDDEHEVRRWCRLVASAGGDCGPEDLRLPVVGRPRPEEVLLHPGAAAPARRWPPQRWAALAAALRRAGRRVSLTGSVSERALCARVAEEAHALGGEPEDLSGALDVAGLATRVAGARLLVSGDTGVAHVATAVGTPSVLLFGPTPPALWGPLIDVDRHVVLWHGAGAARGDPHGTGVDPALARIGVDEVLDAALVTLSG